MSDLQLYCTLMFWCGVFLTRVIFHIEKKWKEREFHLKLSEALIRLLYLMYLFENVKLADDDAVSKKNKDIDEEMSFFTNLVISSLDEKQKRSLVFNSWKEAKHLIHLINKKEKRKQQ